MNYTEKFPNNTTFEAALEAAMPDIVTQIIVVAGPLEADYLLGKRWVNVSATLFIISALVLGLFFHDGVKIITTSSFFVSGGLVALGVICFMSGIRVWKYSRRFKNDFVSVTRAAIYKQAFSLLGLTTTQRILPTAIIGGGTLHPSIALESINRFVDTPEKQQVLALLDHSELVTEERNTVLIDDMILFEVTGRSVFCAELNVQHITGSGKNRKVKSIFHGYFVSCDLPRTLLGKTFVSTDGDRNGFGHRSFWTKLTATGASDTTLEWNDFENLLHVSTTDPVEARVILSPDFMTSLYDWWNGRQQNIRVSFIDTRMYVLFPSSEVRMFTTIKKIETEAIKQEILAICRPLIPILHLIETLPKIK